MIKLSELQPNENNPRNIKAETLENLCRSIERDPEFMTLRPIVVDDDNIILGGNQRYQACLKLGKTEVPDEWVKKASNMTEEQRKRFVIIDNAPEGISGYWNYDILQEHWDHDDLDDLGFIFNDPITPKDEWEGMPEFENNPNGAKSIIVHFETLENFQEFCSLIGNENVTEKTKSIWYPEKPREDLKSMGYENES